MGIFQTPTKVTYSGGKYPTLCVKKVLDFLYDLFRAFYARSKFCMKGYFEPFFTIIFEKGGGINSTFGTFLGPF